MVDFRINVVVSTDQAKRQVGSVNKALDGANRRANNLRRTMRRAFLVLGGGTLIFKAIRTLSSFGQSMAIVGAVTSATEEQFQQLSDTAQRLGITTVFTATQAADAMVKLARAGFEVEEANAAVADTLRLAQAGGLGLAQAADIAASTLRGFRIAVSDAARVTDVLTLSSNRSNTTVAQLGEGLKFVAPIAAGLGVKLEQTAAAMGVIADAGLKATLAGTGLRRVLAELEAPTGATQKILKSMGVTADEVRVSQVGLAEALTTLRDAGIDTGTALQVFGQRGGPAFEILVRNIPKIEKMTTTLKGARGEAKRVADILDKTLRSALLRTASAFNGVIIAFGESGATDFLIGTLNVLSAALRIVADNAKPIRDAFLFLAATALPLAAARVLALVVALKSATLAMVGLGSSTAATASKLGTIVAPLAVIGGSIAFISNRLRAYKENLKAIVETQKEAATDNTFNQLGAQIEFARKALRGLQQQQDAGDGSANLARRIEALTANLKAQRDAVRDARIATQLANGVQGTQIKSILSTIEALQQQARAQSDVTTQTEIGLQLESELQKLRLAGVDVGIGDKLRIAAQLGIIDGLENQKRILEEIKGPQRQLISDQAALNELYKSGKINLEEMTDKLEELGVQQEDAFNVTDLDKSLRSMRGANDLLQIRLDKGREEAEVQKRLLALRQAGAIQSAPQMKKAIADLKVIVAERHKIVEALREQRRFERGVESLTNKFDETDQVEKAKQLEEVFARRPDLVDDVNRSLDDMKLKSLEASTELGDGFERAFIKMKNEAEDLAAVGEAVVGVFADNMTDALTEFATTGKLNFRDLANSIVNDLIKIIARLLVVQSLSAVFGGPGSNIAGGAIPSFGGARAEGGTVQPGRSFMVGENGPETFVPGRTGTIQPAAAQSAAPPQVNLQVVNVQSEDDIPNAIDGGGSDDALLNFLHRNKDKVKQVVN